MHKQISFNRCCLFAVCVQAFSLVVSALQAQEPAPQNQASRSVEAAEGPVDSLDSPGLGIGDFSADQLQEQLDSVRQFSVTPLRLDLPASQTSAPSAAAQAASQSEQPDLNASPGNDAAGSAQSIAAVGSSDAQPAPASSAPVSTSADNGDKSPSFVPRNYTPPPSRQVNQTKQTLPDSQAPPNSPATTAKRVAAASAAAKAKPDKLDNSANDSVSRPNAPVWKSASLASAPVDQLQHGTPDKQTNTSKTIPLGDPFQLSLHGLIWTYIPGLSQYPKEPEFERELGNLETTFRFHFPTVGRYLLTFSRQFPSTGELEYYNAEIIVQKSSDDAMASSLPYSAARLETTEPVAPLQESPPVTIPKVQLTSTTSSESLPDTSKDVDFRITSQVISDVRKLLKDGELDSAYQTLNSWPERERGDIYQTAAEYFHDAGMNSEAVDMWKRNVGLEGELRSKAIIGIVDALAKENDAQQLLQWLPEFLEQAKREQNSPHQSQFIQTDDFAKVYATVSQLNDSDSQVPDELNSDHILEFYQTYVNLYPDYNSPEILYRMGVLYEQPGKQQDLRRARQLYSNIQSSYPVDHYSQEAAKRLNFLNRQFFVVH